MDVFHNIVQLLKLVIGVSSFTIKGARTMLNTKKKLKIAIVLSGTISLTFFMFVQKDDTDAIVKRRLDTLYAKFNLSVDDIVSWNNSKTEDLFEDMNNSSSRLNSIIRPLEKNHSNQYVMIVDSIKLSNAKKSFNQSRTDQKTPAEVEQRANVTSHESDVLDLADIHQEQNVAKNYSKSQQLNDKTTKSKPADKQIVKQAEKPGSSVKKDRIDAKQQKVKDIKPLVKPVVKTNALEVKKVGEVKKISETVPKGVKKVKAPKKTIVKKKTLTDKKKANENDEEIKKVEIAKKEAKPSLRQKIKDKVKKTQKQEVLHQRHRDKQGRELDKDLYDLAPEVFDFVPLEFEEGITNPCWVAEDDKPWCLPYFYIIGMPDSGSENLWQKLVQHPAVAETSMSGYHWWNRRRSREKVFGLLNHFAQQFGAVCVNLPFLQKPKILVKDERDNLLLSFKNYINIGKPVVDGFEEEKFGMVYGDHSTSLFWDNTWWDQDYPGYQEAPKYTTADILGTVYPKAKLLLIVDEPAVTIYTNYLLLHRAKATPDDFDERVANSIDIFEECLQTKTPRTCVYEEFNAKDKTIRLKWGMFYQYFEDWLKVFPLSQIHVIAKNDLEKNCLVNLPKIFSFLDLERVSMRKTREICQSESTLSRKIPENSEPMDKSTKELLESYFSPYFDKLDKLLQDYS